MRPQQPVVFKVSPGPGKHMHSEGLPGEISSAQSHAMEQIPVASPTDCPEELTGRLIAAQEQERKRIARELHDTFMQELVDISAQINLLKRNIRAGDSNNGAALELLEKRLADFTRNLRDLSHRLHPAILDDLGLEAAVEAELEAFSRLHPIKVTFSAKNVSTTLDSDISLCLYRVIQESLRNIAKHSQARQVFVRLFVRSSRLELVVQDTGDGFDVAAVRRKGTLGLISMRERVRQAGGTLEIHSSIGKGTRLSVNIPTKEVAEVSMAAAMKSRMSYGESVRKVDR